MAKNLTDKQKSMLGSAATGLSSGIGLGTSLAQIDDTSSQEALIEGVGSTQFAGGDTSTLLSSFDANNMARTNYTANEIRGFTDGQLAGNILASTATGALSGAMKGGWVGALLEGGSNLIGGTVGALAGNAKAQKRAVELNSLAEENNRLYLNNFANAASNTQNKMFNSSLLNIGAYGGPLFNHGGDWSNGLTFIDEGGTHEQNPLGGVPVGVDQEGTPNLVEEGEIIWNDYVFSNRLKPTKRQLETIGFDSKYEGYTFAKIVEDIQKASAENPLDKISTDTLNENLMYLMTMQEEIRMKKEAKKNKFKCGGVKNTFPNGGNIWDDLTEEEIADIDADTSAILDEGFMPLTIAAANASGKNASKNPWWQSAMRYASPALHGILLANNLQKPDYSDEQALMRKASNMTRGSHTPIGTTLDLDLMDRNVYTNPILANAAANRRAIQQGPTDPRAALLANNYITNNAIGMADIQGTQANNAIKAQKAQFDVTREQANAELALRDLAMDQQADQVGLNVMANAIQSMSAKNAMRNQAISAEASGLADDFGAISREAADRYLMDKLISSGALQWTKAKNGGMLTRNRRRK